MAVLVFRAGTSHTIKGILCEMKRIPLAEMSKFTSSGWVTRPELLAGRIDKSEPVKLPNSEVREAARQAGIEGWKTKRFSTLREELDLE